MHLTPRERSVARLVLEGYDNREIGDKLGCTEGTVKVYISRIYNKFDLNFWGHQRVRLVLKLQSDAVYQDQIRAEGGDVQVSERPGVD